METTPFMTSGLAAALLAGGVDDTRQATLIAMLRAPDGATIERIMTATDGKSHMVRGAMAGALKKTLGLEVTAGQVEARGRVQAIR